MLKERLWDYLLVKVHNLLIVPVGAWSLANSDLVERLKEGAPLNEADPTIFFGAGIKGYTDYPT